MDSAGLRATADEVKQQLGAVPMPGDVADAIAAALASEPVNR